MAITTRWDAQPPAVLQTESARPLQNLDYVGDTALVPHSMRLR